MNAPNSNLIIDGLFLCDHRRLAGGTMARDGSAVARALNSQDNRTSEIAYGPLRRRSGSPTRSGRGELALAASTTRRTRTPSQSETVRNIPVLKHANNSKLWPNHANLGQTLDKLTQFVWT